MKRLITLSCFIIVLVVGYLLVLCPAPPAPPAPVIVMPLPYRIPPQKLSLFDTWVPQKPGWAWLWRLKSLIVGLQKHIHITATFIDLTNSGESFLTNAALAKPQFTNTNGLRVWLLGDKELTALRRNLERTPGTDLLTSAGITTASGMEARLFSGNTIPINGFPTSVGLSVDLLPRARRDATDVTTIITFSEAVTNQPGATPGPSQTGAVSMQTNLAVAARIQVPKAMGVFLLDAGSGAPHPKRIGVILSITPPAPQK